MLNCAGLFSFKDLKEIILSDHNYSRRDSHGCNLKPTKNLFSSRRYCSSSENVDVTTVQQENVTEYDAVKSLQLMEECERFAIFARERPEETPEDWEESIPRIDWSKDQLWLFQKVATILHADRLARLALKGSWSEAAKRRAHVDRTAQRFRNAMAAIAWDSHLTQWLHSLLVDNLDISYLAAYIDILQSLKVRIPTLVERMLVGGVYGQNPVVEQGMKLLLKRPWDPAVSTINAQKLGKLPGNPVIVLIPSSLKKAQSTPRCNLWSSHLTNLATLITVTPTAGTISAKMTPQAYLEQMVSATKTRLSTIRTELPNRPVVLVGWRSGAAVALQAAATESVLAIICLGLATRTVEGPRGDPDDSIYNISCPVLFVTGEQATTSRPEDLEEIRTKLNSSTGLVVVGSSDDCLRMSRRRRIENGLTQSLVDRAVLEAIGEFLADLLLQPESPCPPTSQMLRKRQLSTDSSIDSEDVSAKQARLSLPGPVNRSMNGTMGSAVAVPGQYHYVRMPGRRGRKPGSLNKTTKVSKTIKTLQTLSPVKRPQMAAVAEKSSGADVSLDVAVGLMGSLGTTGPIMRSGSPQVGHTVAPPIVHPPGTATFRIQAGRVSAASVPPADVMPPRSSDTFGTPLNLPGATICKDEESSPPIMTLTVTPRSSIDSGLVRPVTVPSLPSISPARVSGSRITAVTSLLTPSPPTTVRLSGPSLSSPSPTRVTLSSPVRPASRFPFNSPNKIIQSRNVIKMSGKRPLQSSSSVLANCLTGNRLSKGIASTPARTPSVGMGQFALPKRFSSGIASGSSQQKPIVVKSRVIKSNDELDCPDGQYMIVKSHSHEKKDDKIYVQTSVDSDMPLLMMNRTVNLATDVGEPKKQSALILKERPKHLVLSTGSGEQYLVQNRSLVTERRPPPGQVVIQERRSAPTYILNYHKEQDETLIYQVIDE